MKKKLLFFVVLCIYSLFLKHLEKCYLKVHQAVFPILKSFVSNDTQICYKYLFIYTIKLK